MTSSCKQTDKNEESFSLVLYRPQRLALLGCISQIFNWIISSWIVQCILNMLRGLEIVSKLKRNLSIISAVVYVLISNLRLHTEDNLNETEIIISKRIKSYYNTPKNQIFYSNDLPQDNLPPDPFYPPQTCVQDLINFYESLKEKKMVGTVHKEIGNRQFDHQDLISRFSY